MFACAFTPEISSIFVKSLPFPFPYFVLFMSSLETQIIRAFYYVFKRRHKYVDDIFAVIPNIHIQDTLTLLNIQDNSIRFTLDTKIDGQLPFFKLTNYMKFQQTNLWHI